MPTRSLLSLLLAAFMLAGCYTSAPAPRASEAPAYTRSAGHYRAFADADALSDYLRAGSEAGLLVSAHRGGPAPAFPENALATFDRSLRYAPALIECDVRMSRDSALVLMHDETLDRTTTGSGPVGGATLSGLRSLLLKDPRGLITPFRIPTLDEALAWAEGRAVLTLDVKPDVPPTRLIEAVRRAGAENRVVVIVYSLDALLRYHTLAPEMMLSASIASPADVEALLAHGVDPRRLIAFTGVLEGVDGVDARVIDALHALGIRAMAATFGPLDARALQAGPEALLPLFDRGLDMIATDEVPAAARAAQMHPRHTSK